MWLSVGCICTMDGRRALLAYAMSRSAATCCPHQPAVAQSPIHPTPTGDCPVLWGERGLGAGMAGALPPIAGQAWGPIALAAMRRAVEARRKHRNSDRNWRWIEMRHAEWWCSAGDSPPGAFARCRVLLDENRDFANSRYLRYAQRDCRNGPPAAHGCSGGIGSSCWCPLAAVSVAVCLWVAASHRQPAHFGRWGSCRNTVKS